MNILNKQRWTADKKWFSSLGVAQGLSTPHHKIRLLWNVTESLEIYAGLFWAQ